MGKVKNQVISNLLKKVQRVAEVIFDFALPIVFQSRILLESEITMDVLIFSSGLHLLREGTTYLHVLLTVNGICSY